MHRRSDPDPRRARARRPGGEPGRGSHAGTKAQREVVIFSPGLAQGTALESAFYNFVEFNAIALAAATLGTRYNAVHIVRGAAATRGGLANTLNEDHVEEHDPGSRPRLHHPRRYG